jgi:hypothetical protein
MVIGVFRDCGVILALCNRGAPKRLFQVPAGTGTLTKIRPEPELSIFNHVWFYVTLLPWVCRVE